MEKPPQSGETFELSITSLGYGGEGVGKSGGMVFFVPRALPGDKLLVTAKNTKKRYGSARIKEILVPSPHRRKSRCGLFDEGCGGCQWLELEYQEQLHQKTHTIREMIKRISKLNVPVIDIMPSSALLHCRNKLSVRFGEDGAIGLNRENSHEVLDLNECMMETREIQQVFYHLKKMDFPAGTNQIHLRSSPNGKVAVYLFVDEYDESYKDIERMLRAKCAQLAGFSVKTRGRFYHVGGPKNLHIEMGGIEYLLPAGGFFQTNYTQASVLLDQVIKAIGPKETDSVLDLYCGVGFFTLPVARRCRKAFGIEFDRVAASAAGAAAEKNGITNVAFVAGDVRQKLSKIPPGSYSTVILDPPRAGCHPSVLNEIVRISPAKVVYVSCAPDTLARDLGILSERGYRAESMQPIDMFPQTYHAEVVTTLTKG